jgi:pteridine reductase
MKNGKALITGATGSIGGTIAVELARRGYDLALHYNTNEKRAVQLAAQTKAVGRKILAIQADMRRVGDINKLVGDTVEGLGGLSLLVHCAAVFTKSSFEDVSEEAFDETISVNLKAAFFIAQETARVMADEGKMIFMSDIAAVKPYAGYLPYCIAKAGVDSLVKGLAKKYAPRIAVNAIAPYVVTRPKGMSDAGWNDLISKTPARRESPPQEIAQIVAFLAKASPSLTGQIIAVDGGRLLR